jgi:hypothetical protein
MKSVVLKSLAMTIDCMPYYLLPRASPAVKWPRCSVMRPEWSSTGSDDSRNAVAPDSWMENVLAAVLSYRKSIWRSSEMLCAKIHTSWGYVDRGTARLFPYSSGRHAVVLHWAFGNASVCLRAWVSGFANLVRKWPMQIRNSRQHIKKLHDLDKDARFYLWPLDEVRFERHGSSCRMWIPLRPFLRI